MIKEFLPANLLTAAQQPPPLRAKGTHSKQRS